MLGHQEPLHRIGQGFANAVNAAMVGRDQAVSIGEADSSRQARGARRSRQASRDQLAAAEWFGHVCSLLAAAPLPVVIARIRFAKPARQTIATWTRRKRTRELATKK